LSRDQVENDDSAIASIGLENLGDLNGQLALCLGVASLATFFFVVASSRSIGKVRKLEKDSSTFYLYLLCFYPF